MTTQGAAALVGVLELLAELLRIAEVQLGADAGGAQRLHHLLVVGDALLLHHRDDDGAVGRRGLSLLSAASAACRRETPMEKPVAGTFWPVKRATRSS